MYNRTALIVLTLLYCVIFSAASLKAQDVLKVAPKNYKLLIDNDKFRVIDFHDSPGEKTAWHSHPDYLVYVIEGGTIKITTKDGKSKTSVFKKGQTLYLDPVIHENENVGKTKVHLLLVEFKDKK